MRTIAVIAVAIAAFGPAAARAQPTDLAAVPVMSAGLAAVAGPSSDSAASGPSTDLAPRAPSNHVGGGRAQPADATHVDTGARPSDLVRADALFRVAQELRAAGLYTDACPKFAETQRLVPGIGVTLYLADCYEHLGRPARAWSEFRKAERLAVQRKDSRANVARGRAAALEPKLKRVTLAVSEPVQRDGLEVMFDGASIPPDRWNVALAADPGEHVVAFRLGGRDTQTIHVRIDPQAPPLIVPLGEEASAERTPSPAAAGATPTGPALPAAAPSLPAAGAPIAAPAPGAAVLPTASVTSASSSSGADVGSSFHLTGAARGTLELGLAAGGVAAIALGAGFLAINNHAIETDHTSSAGVVSAATFGIGAGALVSSVVLYLTAPSDKSSALVLSPVPVAGGGGAVVSGRF